MKALDTLIGTFWWILLIVGMIAQDWWLFAPAAFFIVLGELEADK